MFAKQHILNFTIAALFLLPITAWAGADTGFYLGAGLGQSTLETDDKKDADGDNIDFSGSDTAYKIIAGYNMGIIPLVNIAVEGSYVDFGKPSDNGVDVKLTGWDAFGLAGLNFGIFSVFGKIGIIAWDEETSGAITSNTSGSDPAYGLGAALQILGISARAEIEYFDISELDAAYLGTISVLYTF